MPLPKTVTWVAVADGGKALLMVNEGTAGEPRLSVLSSRALDNPPAREQGSDRPGRFADAGPNQRSAAEATDWHSFAEARFAEDFASLLNHLAARERFDRLILIAPDRVLGHLRPALSAETTARVTHEITKDLTNHPIPEIETILARALFPDG